MRKVNLLIFFCVICFAVIGAEEEGGISASSSFGDVGSDDSLSETEENRTEVYSDVEADSSDSNDEESSDEENSSSDEEEEDSSDLWGSRSSEPKAKCQKVCKKEKKCVKWKKICEQRVSDEDHWGRRRRRRRRRTGFWGSRLKKKLTRISGGAVKPASTGTTQKCRVVSQKRTCVKWSHSAKCVKKKKSKFCKKYKTKKKCTKWKKSTSQKKCIKYQKRRKICDKYTTKKACREFTTSDKCTQYKTVKRKCKRWKWKSKRVVKWKKYCAKYKQVKKCVKKQKKRRCIRYSWTSSCKSVCPSECKRRKRCIKYSVPKCSKWSRVKHCTLKKRKKYYVNQQGGKRYCVEWYRARRVCKKRESKKKCKKWKKTKVCIRHKYTKGKCVLYKGGKSKRVCSKYSKSRICIDKGSKSECTKRETKKKCDKYKTVVKKKCEKQTPTPTATPKRPTCKKKKVCVKYKTTEKCKKVNCVTPPPPTPKITPPPCTPGQKIRDKCIKKSCSKKCEKEVKEYEPCTKWAKVWAEPHMQTLDGYPYTLAAAGDFLLMRSKIGRVYVVGRSQPAHDANGNRLLGTDFTAIGVVMGKNAKLAANKIEFYARPPHLVINGRPTEIPRVAPLVLSNGITVEPIGENEWTIVTPYHIAVMIKLQKPALDGKDTLIESYSLNVNFRVSDDLFGGKILSGLLGNYNGKVRDDRRMVKRIKTWLINTKKSPLQHPPYHAPKNWHALSENEVAHESKKKMRNALRICKQCGLKGYKLKACVYDVSVTEDPSWCKIEANVDKQEARDMKLFGAQGLGKEAKAAFRRMRKPRYPAILDHSDSESDSESDEDEEEEEAGHSNTGHVGMVRDSEPAPDGIPRVWCRHVAHKMTAADRAMGYEIVDCPNTLCTDPPTLDLCVLRREGKWSLRWRRHATQCLKVRKVQTDKCCGQETCIEWSYKDPCRKAYWQS